MDTNEYEYEYELPSHSQNLSYTIVEQDPLIDAMRKGDIGEDPKHPQHEQFDPVEPYMLTVYLDLKTDSLQTPYFNGSARGKGGNYILDVYPNLVDYKNFMPGGTVKTTVLHTIDEIRTTGVIENNPLYHGVCAGKVQKRLDLDYKLVAQNISFIWIPGDTKTRHQIWWFENDKVVQFFPLKHPKKIEWVSKQ
tara:strand:+ start:74 stop:652 length:579 start_codon:yes stop_codon:yes gene_type:complete